MRVTRRAMVQDHRRPKHPYRNDEAPLLINAFLSLGPRSIRAIFMSRRQMKAHHLLRDMEENPGDRAPDYLGQEPSRQWGMKMTHTHATGVHRHKRILPSWTRDLFSPVLTPKSVRTSPALRHPSLLILFNFHAAPVGQI